MRSGGVVRSRRASVSRTALKNSTINSKPRLPKPSARKTAKSADYESESAVSSDEDQTQSKSEGEINDENEEGKTQRRTRGLQQDLKSAFSDSDDESESSSDDYNDTAEENENIDDHMSDAEMTLMAKDSAQSIGMARHFSRSGSPPTTPGRFVRAERPSFSPLTPPSTTKSIVESFDWGEMSVMSRDQKIKQDFSGLKGGMMLSVGHSPSSPNTSRKISAGNTPYVQESAIFESIECDEEECDNFESADEEMGEGVEDEDEDEDTSDEVEAQVEPVVQKGAIGTPPVPAAKTSISYFQWMRTAVNRP